MQSSNITTQSQNSTISVCLPIELAEQLDTLAKTTSRSKSLLTIQALQELLARETWQIAEIQNAIKDADAGDFASNEEMALLHAKWAYNTNKSCNAG